MEAHDQQSTASHKPHSWGHLERSVAFFTAVDSRPMLFLSVVALESIRRFHPQSSYFILMPEMAVGGNNSWSSLLHRWSEGGRIKPLSLAARHIRRSFTIPATTNYSAMTFHRHRVPQMLARQFKISVNVDPDVFCVRPWDLSLLQRVGLIGGRLVGSSGRTAAFVNRRLLHDRRARAQAKALGGAATFVQKVMNITHVELHDVETELNGGVLVWNNSEAVRVRWWQTLSKYHNTLRRVIEGDQDLVSLVLAAHPRFRWYHLPVAYNYAFRRDRDRLPDAIARRMRYGVAAHEVTNVHFVRDGKPWSRQQLVGYPGWLLAARLHYLRQWLAIARAVRPRLQSRSVGLTTGERHALGSSALDALDPPTISRAGGLFSTLVEAESLRRCFCFLQGLASGPDAWSADPLRVLSFGMSEVKDELTVSGKLLPKQRAVRRVQRERQELMLTCGAHLTSHMRSCAQDLKPSSRLRP